MSAETARDSDSAAGLQRTGNLRASAWTRIASALRAGLMALLFGATLTMTSKAESAAETLEYRVKAAFVCKFASYIEWPSQSFARPDDPIVIGVIATDAVFEELSRTAAALSAEGRPLVVRKLTRSEPVVGAHLVYITRSGDDQLAETLATLKGRPVLAVTESSRGPALGSMINFVVVDDKIRFDVSPQTAEASQLRISARLLGVARSVVGRGS
jgi:hypothetical protein